MTRLLARTLDALHSRVEAIEDWLASRIDIRVGRLGDWQPPFAGDEFDTHLNYADDTDHAALEPKD